VGALRFAFFAFCVDFWPCVAFCVNLAKINAKTARNIPNLRAKSGRNQASVFTKFSKFLPAAQEREEI